MSAPTRRRFLSAVGVGVGTGFAGCLGVIGHDKCDELNDEDIRKRSQDIRDTIDEVELMEKSYVTMIGRGKREVDGEEQWVISIGVEEEQIEEAREELEERRNCVHIVVEPRARPQQRPAER